MRTSFRPGISSRHERQPGDANTIMRARGLRLELGECHELAALGVDSGEVRRERPALEPRVGDERARVVAEPQLEEPELRLTASAAAKTAKSAIAPTAATVGARPLTEGAEAELRRDQRPADDRHQPPRYEPVLAHALEEVAWRAGLLEPGQQADSAQARAEHEVRDYRRQKLPL